MQDMWRQLECGPTWFPSSSLAANLGGSFMCWSHTTLSEYLASRKTDSARGSTLVPRTTKRGCNGHARPSLRIALLIPVRTSTRLPRLGVDAATLGARSSTHLRTHATVASKTQQQKQWKDMHHQILHPSCFTLRPSP
eukprot:720379-Rhodomonas_salina.5